jgi:hypothetical protein
MPAQAFAVSGAGFLPAPNAEPAEIFVFSSSAVQPLGLPASGHLRTPEFAISAQPDTFADTATAEPTPELAHTFLSAPAPEPVELFVRSAAALAPVAAEAPAPRLAPEFAISAALRQWAAAGPVPAPAPEPVARFLQLSNALAPAAALAAAPRLWNRSLPPISNRFPRPKSSPSRPPCAFAPCRRRPPNRSAVG